MTRTEQAVAHFQDGFNCAQAVLQAFAGEALDSATAAKLAGGFGGGMGCLAGTCGAVTGAYMVLGLWHGAVSGKDKAAKENTYRLVREFAARFRERQGALDCRDLLGCDISRPGGTEEARQKGRFVTVCPRMVQAAAEILEEFAAKAAP